MQNRVRFFSKSDLSVPSNVQMAEKVVEEYKNGRTPCDINDYLEMYQILLFMENGIYSKKWNEEEKALIASFSSTIAKFFNSLTPEKLPSVYSSLHSSYSKVFWEVIDRYKIQGLQHLSKDTLHALFVNNHYGLIDVLECQRLVKNNSRVLSELLKENEHAAEWLLASYVEDVCLWGNKKQIHIPASLSSEEKDAILSKYIDSPNANLNYIRLILMAKNSQDFKVSDKTRLKAQRKERDLNNQVLSVGNFLETRCSVCMSDDKNAPIKDAKLENGFNLSFTYNSLFLLRQDPVGLIRYCALVFEMATQFGFITLISKSSENDLMDLFGIPAQHTYPTNFSFMLQEKVALLQTEAMQNVLRKDGRSIEGMLSELYKNILPKTFGLEIANMEFAKESDSWKQKCLMTLPLMENLVKQYSTYVENGEVDPELVSIMSPMKVTSVQSTIKKKYYVINGKQEDLWHLFHLFFSDQCMLTYVEPHKEKHFHCFFDMISKVEEVNYNNYEDYQKSDIDYLGKAGFLSVSDEGVIRAEKTKDILLLKQLYEYQACSYWHYDSDTQNSISKMVEKGWLIEDNHLLTPCERDYFSYYLNNEKYTNGPALRNEYMHGADFNRSEEEHKNAYFRILNLLLLLTIKIYDDLSLKKIYY